MGNKAKAYIGQEGIVKIKINKNRELEGKCNYDLHRIVNASSRLTVLKSWTFSVVNH